MRRFHFTIRDWLWLMVVIGLVEGWWLDHRRVEYEAERYRVITNRYAEESNIFRQREMSLREREEMFREREE